VTERNVSLLFSGELRSDCYDAVLTAARKEGSHIFDILCFHRQPLLKTFPLISLQITRESKKLSALLFFQFIYKKVGVEQVRHFST
jgi:hypothetical protein